MNADRIIDSLIRSDTACRSVALIRFLEGKESKVVELSNAYTSWQELLDASSDALFDTSQTKEEYISASRDEAAALAHYEKLLAKAREYLGSLVTDYTFIITGEDVKMLNALTVGDLKIYKFKCEP